jgi:predicted  nucleic acid-binding Zn-ribbon protein
MSSIVIVLVHPDSAIDLPPAAFVNVTVLGGCKQCNRRSFAYVPDPYSAMAMTGIECGGAQRSALETALPRSTYVLRVDDAAAARAWIAAWQAELGLSAVYVLDDVENPQL